MTLPGIRIWTGPAGSGKSTAMVDEIAAIVNEKPLGAPIYWIVPDDVAFFAEQMLLRKLKSVLRAEVITMSRLADRVRAKVGNTHLVSINRAGKRLLLAAAYGDMRDDLAILGSVQATGGFYDLVLDTFDEMTSYNVNLEALQGALEAASASIELISSASARSGHSLIGKLRDLCALYVRYRRMLDERHFFDLALNLADASRCVPDVTELREANIYIDGFDGFVPNQLEFAVSLAQAAERTTFAFSVVDSQRVIADFNQQTHAMNELHQVSEFHQAADFTEMLHTVTTSAARETPSSAIALLQLIDKLETADISYRVDEFAPTKRFSDAKLSAVEQSFHGDSTVSREGFYLPEETVEERQSVRLWRASTLEEESRETARDILRLVDDHQLEYRDVAVIVPDLNDSGRAVAKAFAQSQIPCAIDVFPSIALHPLGRFTIAVLRFVASDMSVDATARLLRTAFVGLSEADATWLDIYVRQHQIEGSDEWSSTQSWMYASAISDDNHHDSACRADERANRLRLRLMATFGTFFHKMDKGTVTPHELAIALWDLFEAVEAKAALAKQIVREDVNQNPLQASQDEQVWQQFVNLLNDLATVHQDAHFVREELFELVVDLLVAERQTTIPSGVNQVFVTTYRNAHMWSKSHVYVVGLSRENLPKWSHTPGLLQDDEREAFRGLFGSTLAPTSIEQLELDKEIAYELLTRATDSLTLSYRTSGGGFESLPARVYHRIQTSLCIEPVDIGEVADSAGSLNAVGPLSDEGSTSALSQSESLLVMTQNEALTYLVSRLSAARRTGTFQQLLSDFTIRDIGRWFFASEERQSTFLDAVGGLQHDLPRGRISRELATQLYGSPLKTSVNRLETYAACPYRYFLRYGLGLQSLVFDSLEAVDVGNLLHDTIYDLVKLDSDGDIDFRQMDLPEMLSLADTIYRKQLNKRVHAVFKSRKWREARADDLAVYVRSVAEILHAHANRGRYRPYALEWSFGLDDSSSKPLVVTLQNGEEVHLRGRIDRLDTHTENGVTWFRIFDYKSGTSNRIDLTRLFYGLQMQLFVYMAAVNMHLGESGETRPAGAFYLPMVTQPGISDVPADNKTAKAQLYKLFRAQGYMSSSTEAIAAMDERLADLQSSELFGSMYRKDGSFLKTAKVWTEQEWSSLISFTLRQVERLSTDVTRGKIPVRPYFIAHDARACTHCEFAAVCHFEPADHARSYKVVTQKKIDDYMVSASSSVEGSERS